MKISQQRGASAFAALAALAGCVAFASGCRPEEPIAMLALQEVDVVPSAPLPVKDMVIVSDEGPFAHHRKSLPKDTSQRRLLFLNRHGGTYTPSYYNDSSQNLSTVPQQTSVIPPFQGTDDHWQAIMECVRREFERWNVQITDQDPGDAVFVEAVLGGAPGHLGLPSGVAGVSPFTCSNNGVIERAIVFTFTEATRDVPTTCLTTVHEIGHAYGLDHIFYCPDPMTYLHGCGPKTFQDRDSPCGEYSSRQCYCGGYEINSVRHLTDVLGHADHGPDTTPPTIEVLQPVGAELPGNSKARVQALVQDDREVADVILYWEEEGEITEMDCANPPSLVECVRSWTTYTWRFPVSEGERSFWIWAVDAAGNETETQPRHLVLNPNLTPEPYAVAVDIISPPHGSQVTPGEQMVFRAEVSTFGGAEVVRVRLRWSSDDNSMVFEMEPTAVDGEWQVILNLSPDAPGGERHFQVEAQDDSGGWTTSPLIPITIVG